ncbi:SepM family pheromone-processing serine protease [Shouchella patagoniensis]|uniref:SepM family pheromone-processing serine protease n=1 Tax=Shouchella patagoniensis TaxID=228576 RepID=UPI001FE396E7|nr:SepM family pheromone-processing serine protease [Shouchella patagoniensis]
MEENRRKFAWKRWVILFIVILLLGRWELPYYYSQPGIAQTLEGMIDVEEGYKDDTGSFMLTTIRSAKATPILAFWSVFSEFRSLYPAPEDLSDDEYDERQRILMNNSQENAKIAAYQAAGIGEVDIEYNGVYITDTIDGMSADNVIKAGDLITQVDGEDVRTEEELLQKLSGFDDGEEVQLTVDYNGEIRTEILVFTEFPEEANVSQGRVGVGIVGPVTNRTASFDPEVTITAGAIGGPSAGLMFSLEIYSQLLEIDLTKGYEIAGTGTIDEQGNVGPIGGANQKVVAANREGADFFLVPNQKGAVGSNYEEAKEAAESINTSMEIIPIDTIDEALEFLISLPDNN